MYYLNRIHFSEAVTKKGSPNSSCVSLETAEVVGIEPNKENVPEPNSNRDNELDGKGRGDEETRTFNHVNSQGKNGAIRVLSKQKY